jgi:hypothetical protein
VFGWLVSKRSPPSPGSKRATRRVIDAWTTPMTSCASRYLRIGADSTSTSVKSALRWTFWARGTSRPSARPSGRRVERYRRRESSDTAEQIPLTSSRLSRPEISALVAPADARAEVKPSLTLRPHSRAREGVKPRSRLRGSQAVRFRSGAADVFVRDGPRWVSNGFIFFATPAVNEGTRERCERNIWNGEQNKASRSAATIPVVNSTIRH